jgi:hypothetical protein
MKCKIDCFAFDKILNARCYDIDINGRVWPCCNYANVWGDPTQDEDYDEQREDEKLYELFRQDPNWNSLNHHTMDEITSHEIFREYIWNTGWDSDNPPPLCVSRCGEIE